MQLDLSAHTGGYGRSVFILMCSLLQGCMLAAFRLAHFRYEYLY